MDPIVALFLLVFVSTFVSIIVMYLFYCLIRYVARDFYEYVTRKNEF